MPRAVKSILKKIELEPVLRKRTCKNTGREMKAGEQCLVVHDGMYDQRPYCTEVALQMIEAAREKLDELEAQLLGSMAVR